MDKMIHRVVDIISPIASESMPEMLLLVFKNQVELVLLYHKKWNELMDQLGSSPCSEPIQPPMLTIINSINDLFGYYGGYFIEDALSFLLSQMHSLAKESSEDIIPLVQILKSILSHHNPTKCKFD
jgi:hypothetical protein